MSKNPCDYCEYGDCTVGDINIWMYCEQCPDDDHKKFKPKEEAEEVEPFRTSIYR